MAHAPDLVDIARTVQVVSPTEVEWQGQRESLAESPVDILGTPASRSTLLDAMSVALQFQLYYRSYCRPSSTSTSRLARHGAQSARDFAASLSDANQGRGGWERGWRVIGPPSDDTVPVHKDGLTLWVTHGQLRIDDERDGAVSVAIGKELRELMPGFYFARSNEEEPPRVEEATVRLYWNVHAGQAPDLVRRITGALNDAGVPFRFKIASSPSGYDRADAAVLYILRSVFEQVRGLLAEIYRHIAFGLAAETPAFTKRMAPGLGLAEDPRTGDSFGQHRCRLVANALFDAFARGLDDERGRLSVISERFGEAELDPRRPHLDSAAHRDYDRRGFSEHPRSPVDAPKPRTGRARARARASRT